MAISLRALIFIFSLAIFASCGGLFNPPEIGEGARAALQSDERVKIVQNDDIIFLPENGAKAGFVFYPGAYVPPAAYAATMRYIAEAGYLVIVPKMPLNLAILAPSKAMPWLEAYPQIEKWAIGGHSLGGAMAAQFLAKHPKALDALILWAAYPPKSSDLSDWTGKVTSISADLDGLSTPQKIAASKSILPESTDFLVIKGGNHAQFGDYGAQKGDNSAVISKEAQWAEIVEATVEALRDISETKE